MGTKHYYPRWLRILFDLSMIHTFFGLIEDIMYVLNMVEGVMCRLGYTSKFTLRWRGSYLLLVVKREGSVRGGRGGGGGESDSLSRSRGRE